MENRSLKTNEKRLISRAISGEKKAIGHLYSLVRNYIYPYLISQAGENDAQDMVSEIFISAWKNLRFLRSQKFLFTYIWKAAANKIRDNIRKRKRHSRVNCFSENASEGEALEISAPFFCALANLEGEELLARIYQSLTPQERELFELVYVRGDEAKEASDALNVTLVNYRTKKFRLNEKLRRLFRKYGRN